MSSTKGDVEARIMDWVHRLNALYATLDLWREGIPDTEVDHGELPQVIEPLMKQFNVGTRPIPTYTVYRQHRKKRIAFVPSAIWIIGANGRVNVTTNVRQHILVDIGGREGQPSKWRLIDTSDRTTLKKFDRHAFRGLLEEGR